MQIIYVKVTQFVKLCKFVFTLLADSSIWKNIINLCGAVILFSQASNCGADSHLGMVCVHWATVEILEHFYSSPLCRFCWPVHKIKKVRNMLNKKCTLSGIDC